MIILKIRYSKKSFKFLARKEAEDLEEAEISGYIDSDDIDWNDLKKYE